MSIENNNDSLNGVFTRNPFKTWADLKTDNFKGEIKDIKMSKKSEDIFELKKSALAAELNIFLSKFGSDLKLKFDIIYLFISDEEDSKERFNTLMKNAGIVVSGQDIEFERLKNSQKNIFMEHCPCPAHTKEREQNKKENENETVSLTININKDLYSSILKKLFHTENPEQAYVDRFFNDAVIGWVNKLGQGQGESKPLKDIKDLEKDLINIFANSPTFPKFFEGFLSQFRLNEN